MFNKLSILVFRNDLSSRSFRVSIASLFWLSLVLASITFVLIGSITTAFHYYRESTHGDIQSYRVIQQELSDLRRAYEALQAQQKPAGDESTKEITPKVVAPTTATTTTATTASADEKNTPSSGSHFLFKRLLPSPTQPTTIEPSSPRAYWSGKTLNVRFDLKYVGPENGSQQGRIVILARGPHSLYSYPSRAFQSTGSNFLIDPENGEHFSVSRFRETRASFGPFNSQNDITEVEVYVLNQSHELLVYQVLKVTPKALPPPPAPAPVVAPPIAPSNLNSSALQKPDSSPNQSPSVTTPSSGDPSPEL